MEHIRSYYAATANANTVRAPLRGDIEADVCIVGGGIAGCSTALHLAERGYRVVLLEAHRVGWGASGRSGGQVIFGYASSQDKLIGQVGRADARRMFDLSLEAVDLVRERVERHRIDCDLHWGHLHAAIKPRHEKELRAWQEELARENNYTSVGWLDARRVRELLATERYIGGLYDTRSGHLHPLNYTLGLAAAAEAAGALMHESSPVVTFEHGAVTRVRTASGATVRAKHVALCATLTSTTCHRRCVRESCRSERTSSPPSRSAQHGCAN